jgi:hypothetical protein
MRESILKAVVFWLVVCFTAWAVWWNIGNLTVTVIATLLLLGSLSSFYLPTVYTIDERGVGQSRITSKRFMEWSRVRSIVDEKEGLFLSAFAGRTMMENFRGLYLPYRGNREVLLDLVKARAGEGITTRGAGSQDEKPVRNYFGHRK